MRRWLIGWGYLWVMALPASAVDLISDEDMREVQGQSGVDLSAAGPSLSMGSLAWSGFGNTLTLNNLNLTPIGSVQYQSALSVDVGSNGALAAVSTALNVQPFQLSIGSVTLNGGSASYFDAALQALQPLSISYKADNGLFASNGALSIKLPSARLFLGQSYNGYRDLLIMDKVNLAASYTGAIGVNATDGLVLNGGTLSLSPLSFDLAYNGNQPSGYSTSGEQGLVHVSVKGNIDNLYLSTRSGGNAGIISATTGLADSTPGLTFKTSGQLDTASLVTNVGPVGGTTSYGVEFSHFVPFSNYNASNPQVSLGTTTLDILHAKDVLPDLFSGYGLGLTAGVPSLGMTVRGMNFQAYPTQFDFYNYATATSGAIQNWSLISTFYNVSSDVILAPGGYWSGVTPARGIGLSLSLATTPYDAGGVQGTHILIADTTSHQYIGLRNIDLRAKLDQAQLYLLDPVGDGASGLRLTAQQAKLSLASQLAIGALPNGSTVTGLSKVPDGSTLGTQDDLFGLGATIGLGSGGQLMLTLKPVTGANSYLAYDLALTGLDPAQTSVTITEPVDGTQAQFANISGSLYVNNGQVTVGAGNVTFAQDIVFGSSTAPFTIGSINFNKATSAGTGGVTAYQSYRLGEIAMPGSTIHSAITLSPK